MRLLIFDNLEDATLWQRWQPPPASGCRVLITTRRGQWPKHSGVQKVHLPPLVLSESRDLLLGSRAVQQETTVAALLADTSIAAAVDAIAKAVDGLPLALALAAAYLEALPGVSVPRYRVQLEARAAQIVNDPSLNMVLADDLPTKHATSIAATFALSYDQLDPAALTDALALRLLHVAAVAAPEPIPRPLLYRAGADDPLDDDPLSPETADPALARLNALGLLDELPDTTLRLHRLLAAYVQTCIVSNDGTLMRLAAALNTEAYAINMAGYPLVALPYLPHLRLIVTWIDPHSGAATALLNNLAELLRAQGDYTALRPLYERALAINEVADGPTHLNTATSLNNLALLLHAQGDYVRARPLLERALTITEAALGDHPTTAQSLNNLAELLRAQDEDTVAHPLMERALAIREATLGPNHPETAQSLNNLATLLVAQGNLTRAHSLMERALAIREANLGPSHPDTAQSLGNLAALLRAQGDYATARPLYERALAITEATLGLIHPSTAISLNNLAMCLEAQRDYAGARPLYDQAVTILLQTLGSDHPNTRTACINRDQLLLKMGGAGDTNGLGDRDDAKG